MAEPPPAEHDLPPVLISEEAIVQRVDELAGQISSDYAQAGEIVLVGVLKGAFIFLADRRARSISPTPVKCPTPRTGKLRSFCPSRAETRPRSR